MFDSEHQLIGVFSDEKYNIGEYEITIYQITNGYKMVITKGDDTQEMTIMNGETPDLANIRDMFNTLRDAIYGFEDAERERAAAEKLRVLAENGPEEKSDPETDEEKKKYRTGLYELMLSLYNQFYPKIDTDLAAIESAKVAAMEARDDAEEAARRSAQIAMGSVSRQIFYYNGDVIKFGHTSEGALVISPSMNLNGYVDASCKTIHIKIPVAKRLDNITSFIVNRLYVSIANSGGYALVDKGSSNGYDYKSYVSYRYVDRVQNCLHIQLKRDGGWKLHANECVSVRIGSDRNGLSAVSFSLVGSAAP